MWSQISVYSWPSFIFYKIYDKTELFIVFTVIFKLFIFDFIYFDCTESFDEQVTVYRLVELTLQGTLFRDKYLFLQNQEDEVWEAPGIRMLFIYSNQTAELVES